MGGSGEASDRLLEVLNAFIGALATRKDWSAAVPDLFAAMGAHLGYDRVALFCVHEATDIGLGVTCRAEWARPGLGPLTVNAHPPIRPLGGGDSTQLEWAARRTRGEIIEGVSDDLPGYLGRYFRENGVIRYLTVPVMVGGRWWGHLAVCVPDRTHVWSDAELNMLKAVAGAIALSVEGSQSEQHINNASRVAMLNSALDGIISINEAGLITEFNPAAEQMFGYLREEVIGRLLGDTVIPPQHSDSHKEGMARYLIGGASRILGRRVEIEGKRANGEMFPIELTVTEVRAENRRLFTAYLRDISEHRAAQAALERLAFEDAATTLPNRAGLLRTVAGREDLAGAVVLRLPDLAILAASLGEDFIEPLITAMAQRLRALLPQGAILARTGESEFAALFFHEGALNVAARLLEEAVQAPIETEGRRFYVRGKIGIAKGGGPVERILRDAEMASRADRDGQRIFDDSLRASHQRRLDLETALREALLQRSEEVFPVFQPIREVATGRIAGFEALARWRHPEREIILPSEFIPLAEEAGLADTLGELILDRASRACAQWNRARAERGLPPRYVSVNLSGVQLSAPDLVPRIVAILERNALIGDHVRFELTESAILSHPVLANRTLQRLRDLGCGIAIDDFGTGYSSLSYLQDLPADVLKFDPSFVQGLERDLRTRKIVSVMADLAHALGMTVVAEGVENFSTLREIRRAGCDFAQGFLLGRPMPAHDAALLEDTHLYS
ncbi:EAL domain-containing protein [Aquabacter sp. CN5-332]|uniref:putative bifunctional diguanylate cyclase/phosphodiesterase n=1 Tax=Aquabacter sp. CN5-332 TaxID=3156608 RepID=UPI0032B31B12